MKENSKKYTCNKCGLFCNSTKTDSIVAELFNEDLAIGIPIKDSTCSHASLTIRIGPLFFLT